MAAPKPTSAQFFPPIGKLADQADQSASAEEVSAKEGVPSTADEEDAPVQEIESLCMKCGEQGSTRLMLTSIPYFKEVILMSFRCEYCGHTNNEVQSAGDIRPQGSFYTTHVKTREDLSRQLVRSSSCTVVIPTFELTLPPPLHSSTGPADVEGGARSGGQLTTIEGLLRDIIADLSTEQPVRKIMDSETYDKIEVLLQKLWDSLGEDAPKEDAEEAAAEVKDEAAPEKEISPFTIQLDDPAGNSFIEFYQSMSDPKWSFRTYDRTHDQNVMLGLAEPTPQDNGGIAPIAEADEELESRPGEEIFVFPGICSSCSKPLDTLMKKVVIPYFKDILIMSTNCDYCGYRDNEVKSGSAISEKGKKITLTVEDAEDMSRDLLKSETAGLSIPEIDLVLTSGTLGGRFTTLEGILSQVYEELSEKVFMSGDSAPVSMSSNNKAFDEFLGNLKAVKDGERLPFTLILDDPLANSYIQNLYAPDDDPAMTVDLYDRTWDQNEELGLNDMKVEGYEQSDNEDEKKETEES